MNYNSLEEEFSDYHKLVNLIDEYENLGMQAEIVSALRGVSSAIDIAKKITDVAQISNNADLIMAIADLKLELANAKIELGKVVSEAEKLEKELEKLKSPEWQLVFNNKKQAFFESTDNDQTTPYCANCWNNKKEKYILYNLNKIGGFLNMGYQCQNCKSVNPNITINSKIKNH